MASSGSRHRMQLIFVTCLAALSRALTTSNTIKFRPHLKSVLNAAKIRPATRQIRLRRGSMVAMIEDSLVGSSATSSLENIDMSGKIHVLGGKLKTTAVLAQLRFAEARALMKPVHLVHCIVCYFLFVIYRAYRGFFVIIPAVFSQVKGRLRAGIVEAETELNADVDPFTGKLRRRSAILISFGALVVTALYSIKTCVGGIFAGLSLLLRRSRGSAGNIALKGSDEASAGTANGSNET